MTMDAAPPSKLRLIGPVACGCLLVGAAAYVAAIDPDATGTHLPACPLYAMTGLWCPGCGLTRATHALLRGHIGAAFGYNLFFPLILGSIVLGWLAWLRVEFGRAPIRWLTRLRPSTGLAIFAAFLTFGVLRNVASLHALAP